MEPVDVRPRETNEAAPVSQAEVAPDPRRWSILAVVVIAQLMVVLDGSIVTIALPSIQRALHISVANRQWVITAYTLAFGGLLLLGGRIADFGGRRRMLIVGLVGFAAASALGGAAVDQAMLFGSRTLQGAFAALMAPAALSILTITFQHDARERAKAFGAYGAVSGAGAAIGVLAGGLLTEYASWRWVLLVNVPIALLAAVAAVRLMSESRAGGKTRYDIPGALLSTAGLVSLVYGFTKAVTDGWSSTLTLTLLAAGGPSWLCSSWSRLALAPPPAAAGGTGTEPGRLVPGHPARHCGPVRHVHLCELLHAADPSLLSRQSRCGLPPVRGGRDRRRRGGNGLAAQDRASRGHDRRAPDDCFGPVVADPDRGAHVVLGPPLPPTDRHEPGAGTGLPRSDQYRADQSA